eukprot:COSAG02_NODE_9249_length_2278_cov_1.292795_3_plen_69_part_00
MLGMHMPAHARELLRMLESNYSHVLYLLLDGSTTRLHCACFSVFWVDLLREDLCRYPKSCRRLPSRLR